MMEEKNNNSKEKNGLAKNIKTEIKTLNIFLNICKMKG